MPKVYLFPNRTFIFNHAMDKRKYKNQMHEAITVHMPDKLTPDDEEFHFILDQHLNKAAVSE